MAFKIGFTAELPQTKTESTYIVLQRTVEPRKSVVQVHFPDRGTTLAYYNDLFDFRCGDIVFVGGKLEGLRGRVVDVNYNFKIKISEYKRVIAVADTEVHGQFHMADSHFGAAKQKGGYLVYGTPRKKRSNMSAVLTTPSLSNLDFRRNLLKFETSCAIIHSVFLYLIVGAHDYKRSG